MKRIVSVLTNTVEGLNSFIFLTEDDSHVYDVEKKFISAAQEFSRTEKGKDLKGLNDGVLDWLSVLNFIPEEILNKNGIFLMKKGNEYLISGSSLYLELNNNEHI